MDTRANRGGEAVVTAIVFNVIAAALVILRWVSRVAVLRNPGIDDYLVIISLILSIGLTVCIVIQKNNGLGRHFDTISPPEFLALMKTLYGSIPIYLTGLAVTKVSIIVQYKRVFVGDKIQRACNIALGIVIVYGMWTFWSGVFTCFPVAKFWDKNIKGGYCLNNTALWFTNASVNIATDLLVFSLPMPVLHSLHLPKRQKIGLMLVFAVGLFVCITSILRLKSLYTASVSTDLTWDNVGAAAWSSVELNVAIICASLPMLKPLIVRMFPKLLGSTRRGAGRSDERAYGYGYGTDRASRYQGGPSGASAAMGYGNVSTVKGGAEAAGWEFEKFGSSSGSSGKKDSGRGSGSSNVGVIKGYGPGAKDLEIGRAVGGESPPNQIKVMTSITTTTREVEDEGDRVSETSSERNMVWRGDELRV
ncbi:MAG: hypothetical protein Q9227_003784 [Pyrenula ochraceoflavens]